MLRCRDRIFSLNTVRLSSYNLKDLAHAPNGIIKMFHRHWNPFQRIKSEYDIRKSFAEELLCEKYGELLEQLFPNGPILGITIAY